jgi:hypothetical protein
VTEARGRGAVWGGRAAAVLFIALAAFASCEAREGTLGGSRGGDESWAAARARLAVLPDLPAPLPGRPFWIGGWVGPPVAARDAETWRTFAEAGIDVSMGPLEDRYVRADNVARLAALDARPESLWTFVRDDSLHPDEAIRPGWERRIEAIVAAYGGARSLAGYFLADEPAPAERGRWTPAARLLRRLDPAHPAYVNFVGILPRDFASEGARARWREEMKAAVIEGELPLFTVDAYPFGRDGGESGHFLATLREAAHVSHATARPFGAVLQFTGHGPLRAATPAEASYQAMEALAHGAACVIWFTYWTPDPSEEPWRWHDGAVAYDGSRTARHGVLAAVDAGLRMLARARGARPMLVAHLGGDLPAGVVRDDPSVVPGVDSLGGGPASLGFSAADAGGARRYVLVHRGRNAPATYRVRFTGAVDSARVLARWPAEGDQAATAAPGPAPQLEVRLAPGGAAVIATWEPPRASLPRMPSPPGTR